MSVRTQPRSAARTWRQTLDDRLDSTMIRKRPLRWYMSGWRLGLVFLVLALLFPLVVTDQSLQVTAISIGIYVLLALGLNIVVGYAGLLDLGYVAFFVIGSYTEAIGSGGVILNGQGKVIHFPLYPFWLLLPLGALLAGLFGVLLGAPTLRLRGDYLAIVTLGFGEIVPVVFQNVPFFYGNLGMSAIPPADVGPITFSDPLNHMGFYYLVLAVVVLLILVVTSLRESSLGRAWIAIREDETAASASGVNLVRTKLLAFGLGATFGGIAGALNAAFLTAVSPLDFQFAVSITVLIMVVLGGLGSIPGVILGAILLRFFDVYLLGTVNDFIHGNPLVASTGSPLHFLATVDFNTFKFLIYGIILVAMILLRPQGLIPNVRRQRELKGIGAAPEGQSAVGLLALEESGIAATVVEVPGATEYVGDGSDAQGREG